MLRNIIITCANKLFTYLWMSRRSSQKEAFFHKVPCVTLRDETEWVELVEADVNILAGADKGRIMQGISMMIEKEIDSSSAVYGRGNAAEKVVEILAEWGR